MQNRILSIFVGTCCILSFTFLPQIFNILKYFKTLILISIVFVLWIIISYIIGGLLLIAYYSLKQDFDKADKIRDDLIFNKEEK